MKKQHYGKWRQKRNYNWNQYYLRNYRSLPRPIEPDDLKTILRRRIKPRDKAIILMLLRTGMRIGELLKTKMKNINLKERKIWIHESAKSKIGRVAYISYDAHAAVKRWILIREQENEYLFYGRNGRPLSYEAARSVFKRCIDKADLNDKEYTLHCLRHTFASELLSAGMPLESLQQLMGHSNIEVTRRYARLSNVALKNDYFDAMNKIERSEADGFKDDDYEI